jgi:predicted MFS family arabinose efflux permease
MTAAEGRRVEAEGHELVLPIAEPIRQGPLARSYSFPMDSSTEAANGHTGPVATRARRPPGGLLAHRNFRLLWIGETVNQFGSAMATVVVPLLAVIVLHASTFEVSLLTASVFLPWLLIGLPAGAWVDRLPARPVMMICDLISAVLYLSVPAAAWLGVLTLAQLTIVVLLGGAANVLFMTAYQVNLTSLVTADQLTEGNAKLQGSASAAALAGPGLAGIAARSLGAAPALLVNAGSFLVSAWCLLRIRTAAASPARTPAPRTRLRDEISAGVGLVAGDRYLRSMSLFGGLANFALDAYAALAIVFLVRVVRVGEAQVGLLMAVPGIGGLVGAMIARRAAERFGSSRVLLLSTAGTLPFVLLIPLTERGPRLAFFVIGTLGAVVGIGVSNVIMATFRQAYSPPGMVGRVTATMRFVVFGTGPLGALAGGALGTWLGVRSALWIVLSLVALSAAPLVSRDLLTGRDLPAAAVQPSAPPAT